MVTTKDREVFRQRVLGMGDFSSTNFTPSIQPLKINLQSFIWLSIAGLNILLVSLGGE